MTDQMMLTLLMNISPSAVPEPFAFLETKVTFLYRMSFPTERIVYHFDPIASWSFEPPLLYKDMIISRVLLEWTIDVMPIEDLIARGFSIKRGH